MITDIAWNIAEWFCGSTGEFTILIFEYLLLLLVWLLGMRLNRKCSSPLVWGLLLALGTFSLTVSGSFVWLLFFGTGGGFGGLSVALKGVISCFALIIFLVMMGGTVSSSFPKKKITQENADPD